MQRFFNTTGPCRPEWHYMVPPIPRLPDAKRLIDQMNYFVVHAPRQTGKTTTLITLAKELTASGQYAALYFTCEMAEPAGDDYERAEHIIVRTIRTAASDQLPFTLHPPSHVSDTSGQRVEALLQGWAEACPRPLVLFFDEIDAIRGQSMISVLRQLRAGFYKRPQAFPASIVLCGLRDVREYKAASGGDPERLGTASPFNIKVTSMKMSNFDQDQIGALYQQYTVETGQAFTADAMQRVWEATEGQPWLVNALAREVTEIMQVPVTESITAEHVDQAKERLILARATHLDSLVSKLVEPRVKRVIEMIVSGAMVSDVDPTYDDALLYCRDLGLVAQKNPVRIANKIYREVIVRVLGSSVESQLDIDPHSFVLPDGKLNLRMMLDEFVSFWCEHGDIMAHGSSFHEVAPQLVLMAFLQRVVNGGGYVEREYGIGRGRIDLLVRWPYNNEGKRVYQREAIELKVWRDKAKDPLPQALKQIDQYLTKLNLDYGVLVIFDRRSEAAEVEERTRFEQATTPSGKSVTLLRA
ncbi:MAG TPA: AAA family ATPase [Polyangium sp.]|nr:AAA family ATPase [Polyangium sp.]